jgi:hypothetical protein
VLLVLLNPQYSPSRISSSSPVAKAEILVANSAVVLFVLLRVRRQHLDKDASPKSLDHLSSTPNENLLRNPIRGKPVAVLILTDSWVGSGPEGGCLEH